MMTAPRLVLVAALDRNGAIGKDNQLPWHLPEDLKRFKALTLGKPVVMGRKTAESLGRALPGRRNLVLTRKGQAPFPGMQAITSLQMAMNIAQADKAEELCVIGGAEIYALALPLADSLYLTHVDVAIDGADTFFPPYQVQDWRCIRREQHPADERHAHAMQFVYCVRMR